MIMVKNGRIYGWSDSTLFTAARGEAAGRQAVIKASYQIQSRQATLPVILFSQVNFRPLKCIEGRRGVVCVAEFIGGGQRSITLTGWMHGGGSVMTAKPALSRYLFGAEQSRVD